VTEIRTRPIDSPPVWIGRDMAARRDWLHVLTPAEIVDLDSAVAHARAQGQPLAAMTRDDFPLTTLARTAERWLDELEHGAGFLLVRGVPVERYGERDATLAY